MTLDIQTPAEKVFGPPKYNPKHILSQEVFACVGLKKEHPKRNMNAFFLGFHDFIFLNFCFDFPHFSGTALDILEVF